MKIEGQRNKIVVKRLKIEEQKENRKEKGHENKTMKSYSISQSVICTLIL